MYYILNMKEEVIGILTNNGKGCPFYDDNHQLKIADSTDEVTNKLIKSWSDTLTLSAPIGYDETVFLTEGNYLVFQDHTGKWKEFVIYEAKETFNEKGHFKTVQAFNACIWDLSHTRIESKSWNGANSKDVFSYIFERSGWRIKDSAAFFSGNLKTYEVAEGTSQAALIEALKNYDVEIQAYVELSNGIITDHVVELAGKLGRRTALRFEYTKNLNGCERTVSDTNFFTKLYVFGANDANGKPRSIASVNHRKPFLLDKTANNKWNGGRKYLEGAITNEKIANVDGLLTWGKRQFQYYNHPHYSYSVDIELLDDDVQIGDSIVVIDREMTPDLQVTARVIQTDFSLSDPTKNKVVLGEFIAIDKLTPQLIWQLKAQANQQDNITKAWSIIIENLGDDDQPNKDTKTTTLQAKVFYGQELMNPIIPGDALRWYERNNDINAEDSGYKFVSFGFVLPNSKYGYEYKVELDDAVKNQIEATLNPLTEDDFKFECRLNLDKNQPGLNPKIKADFNAEAVQYVEIFEGHYYWLQVYKGKDHKEGKAESYTITKTDTKGNILGRIKFINACHGDMFGMRRFTPQIPEVKPEEPKPGEDGKPGTEEKPGTDGKPSKPTTPSGDENHDNEGITKPPGTPKGQGNLPPGQVEEVLCVYTPWYDPENKEWTLMQMDIKDEDFNNDKVFTFNDGNVMFRYMTKNQPRLYRDKVIGNFLVEVGRGKNADLISIWAPEVDFLAHGQTLEDGHPLQLTHFNLTERLDMTESDILQAVAMRYPYLYVSSGAGNSEAVNNSDQATAYCYDIISDKVLWKIVFNWKGAIKPPQEDPNETWLGQKEIETINYANDEKGNTYVYLSFNFGAESDGGTRNEILYKALEKAVMITPDDPDEPTDEGQQKPPVEGEEGGENQDGTSEADL